MLFKIKQNVIALIAVFMCFINTAQATESFDPFFNIRNTPQGQQLLDIAKNAELDVELAKQQLNALTQTGVGNLDLEYQVAEILAYISINHALSELEEVKRYLEKLHLIGVKKNNDWVLSKYFEQQAVVAIRQGHFLKGMEDANRAIEIAEGLNYQKTVANALSIRAILYGRMGQGSESLKDYRDALAYFEKTNEQKKIVTIYMNLVALYLDRSEWSKALEASDKAIEIHELLPRKVPRLLAGNYINRAIALSYLGKKDQELDAYIKAQEYAIKSNDAEVLSTVYANQSDFFLRNQNYTLAVDKAKRCIEIADKLSNVTLESVCQLNQGVSLVYLKEQTLGFELLTNALKIAEEQNMESLIVDIYKGHVEAYRAIDDHETAAVWLEKQYQLLLEQAKRDKDTYFEEVEQNFKETISDREQLHSSLKTDMMENILNQEALVKKLYIGFVLLVSLLIALLAYVFLLKRKLKTSPYHPQSQ